MIGDLIFILVIVALALPGLIVHAFNSRSETRPESEARPESRNRPEPRAVSRHA
jgi:hypothetical protein